MSLKQPPKKNQKKNQKTNKHASVKKCNRYPTTRLNRRETGPKKKNHTTVGNGTDTKHQGFPTGHPRFMTRPAGWLGRHFQKSRVESGQVRRCLKFHGNRSGRAGSGGFGISRVEPGHPGPIRPASHDPKRDKPCKIQRWSLYSAG